MTPKNKIGTAAKLPRYADEATAQVAKSYDMFINSIHAVEHEIMRIDWRLGFVVIGAETLGDKVWQTVTAFESLQHSVNAYYNFAGKKRKLAFVHGTTDDTSYMALVAQIPDDAKSYSQSVEGLASSLPFDETLHPSQMPISFYETLVVFDQEVFDNSEDNHNYLLDLTDEWYVDDDDIIVISAVDSGSPAEALAQCYLNDFFA